MNYIIDVCILLSKLARPHLATVAVAIVTTCLVLAGERITRFFNRTLGRTPFVLRVLAFSLICTFGYGTLAVLAISVVKDQLGALSNTLLSPCLMGLFLAIGWTAERKKYI